MRSLFVFPGVDRSEALRRLSTARVQTELPIGVSKPDAPELIWAEVIEDLAAADFDADDLVAIEQAAGFRPTWGLEIAISGRFPEWRQRDLRALTAWLISDGGVANSVDDDEFKTGEDWQRYWASRGQPI